MLRIVDYNMIAPKGRADRDFVNEKVQELDEYLKTMLLSLAKSAHVEKEIAKLLDALSDEPSLGKPESVDCTLFLEKYTDFFKTIDEDAVMIYDKGFITLLNDYCVFVSQAHRIYRFLEYRPFDLIFEVDIVGQLKMFLRKRAVPSQDELVQFLKNLRGVDMIMSMIIIDYFSIRQDLYHWKASFCRMPKDFLYTFLVEVIDLALRRRVDIDQAIENAIFLEDPQNNIQQVKLETFYNSIERGILHERMHYDEKKFHLRTEDLKEESIREQEEKYDECLKTIEKLYLGGTTNITVFSGMNGIMYIGTILYQIVRSYELSLENFNAPQEVFLDTTDDNVASFLETLLQVHPGDDVTALEAVKATIEGFWTNIQMLSLEYIMDLFAEYFNIMSYYTQMLNILMLMDTQEYTTEQNAQETLSLIRSVAAVVEKIDNSSEIVRGLYNLYDVTQNHKLLILYIYYFSRPEQITKIQKKMFEIVANRWIWKYRSAHKQSPYGVFGPNHNANQGPQLSSFVHSYAKRKSHDLRVVIHPLFDEFYKKCFLASYLEDYESKYSYDEMLQLASWYNENPENLKYLEADFSFTQQEMMRILRSVQSIERRSICTRITAYDTMYQGACMIRDTITELTYYPCAALMEHVHKSVDRNGYVTYLQIEKIVKHNRDPQLKPLREGLDMFFYNYTQTRNVIDFQRNVFEDDLYGIFADAMPYVELT